MADTSVQHFNVVLDSASGVTNQCGGKRGYQRVYSNYSWITFPSHPRKVYARVLERIICPIVEPWFQEEQYSFCPGHGSLDQLSALYYRVHGSLPNLSTCSLFAGICICTPVWVLSEYVVWGSLLRAVGSLYDQSRSLVCIAGNKSDLFPGVCWTPAGVPVATDSVHNFTGQNL